MRVLVVTIVHDPEDARIRHRQIQALLEAGHEVRLAAPFSAYNRALPGELAAIDLPRAGGRDRIKAIAAARQTLKANQDEADVVLLHDPELLLAALGIRHPCLVWDVHEDTAAAISMKRWLPQPLHVSARFAVRRAEHWAERHLHILLAEEAYQGRFKRSHPLVPNSVSVPTATPSPPGTDRVIYIGRLTRARGAIDMVEIGRLLAPDVTVHLIGNADSDCLNEIRSAHERGSIVWEGFLPNSEALRRLDGALAGLSLLHDEPNYAHSRPTKVMEYAAHGVPVVTTPNPASVRLVTAHDLGLVVPFGEPARAAEEVRRLRDDSDLRGRFTRAGRTAALAYFDWTHDGVQFVRTLERWASRR